MVNDQLPVPADPNRLNHFKIATRSAFALMQIIYTNFLRASLFLLVKTVSKSVNEVSGETDEGGQRIYGIQFRYSCKYDI